MTALCTHSPTHRAATAVLLTSALLLTACGVNGGSGDATATTTTTEVRPADAAKALRDAGEATLNATSFAVDSEAKLEIGAQLVRLTSKGSIDYRSIVGDVLLNLDSTDGKTELDIRTDGRRFWVRVEGSQAPTVPDGKTWIQGNASRLKKVTSLEPTGLIGVILALRGTTKAEQTGTGTTDGIATTTYRTTVAYDDAVKAAGRDAKAFTSSLSLQAPSPPDLAMKVEVGRDGIIRKFDLEVQAKGGTPLSGTYRIELTDVNKKVKAPDAPPASDTLTGPRAERILDQIIK
jgi:hypothetical protein